MATFLEIATLFVVVYSHCILSICNFYLFPEMVLRDGFGFDFASSCSLLFYYFYQNIILCLIYKSARSTYFLILTSYDDGVFKFNKITLTQGFPLCPPTTTVTGCWFPVISWHGLLSSKVFVETPTTETLGKLPKSITT